MKYYSSSIVKCIFIAVQTLLLIISTGCFTHKNDGDKAEERGSSNPPKGGPEGGGSGQPGETEAQRLVREAEELRQRRLAQKQLLAEAQEREVKEATEKIEENFKTLESGTAQQASNQLEQKMKQVFINLNLS